MAAISVKSATAPAVTSCEGDGEAQASEDEGSEQMCAILGVDVVWDCGKLLLVWGLCWEASMAWLAGSRRGWRLAAKLVWYAWTAPCCHPRWWVGPSREGWGGPCVLPVAKASPSGTANPCSCKPLAAANAAWTAGGASGGWCN